MVRVPGKHGRRKEIDAKACPGCEKLFKMESLSGVAAPPHHFGNRKMSVTWITQIVSWHDCLASGRGAH